MDADGQHQPSELPGLIQPILDDKVDVVNGSRVLGAADPNHAAPETRDQGVRLGALAAHGEPRLDLHLRCCAVRTEALRDLEFHQDQFHTPSSSSGVEAKLRTMPISVTVSSRLSGASKKPPTSATGSGSPMHFSAPPGSAERLNAVA